MAKLNVMKTINKNRGKINPHYDLAIQNIDEIIKESSDIYNLVFNCFVLGYAQGEKATIAEMKKLGGIAK